MWGTPPQGETRPQDPCSGSSLTGPPRHCTWYGPRAQQHRPGRVHGSRGRGRRRRPTPCRHRGRGRRAARSSEGAEREEREGRPDAEGTEGKGRGRGRSRGARPYLGRRNHRDLLEVVERHGHRRRRATRRKGSAPGALARAARVRPGLAGRRGGERGAGKGEGGREGRRERGRMERERTLGVESGSCHRSTWPRAGFWPWLPDVMIRGRHGWCPLGPRRQNTPSA